MDGQEDIKTFSSIVKILTIDDCWLKRVRVVKYKIYLYFFKSPNKGRDSGVNVYE
jgi:hypothetical protein